MTKAQILKKEILSQYRSVRQFALEMQIPYSTLVTALERGIDGMAYGTVIKMCNKLNLNPVDFSSLERDTTISEQLLENGTRELAQEWGSRMEGNRQAVLSLISRIDRLTGNDSFSRALGESGATCFPGVVRGLLALSRVLSEDSVGAGGVAGSGGADESAIDGLRNAFREHRRRER